MPAYIFKCKEHGAFEIEMKMSEYSDDQVCGKCGKPAKRVFIPIKVNWKQPISGHGVEIYTNEADATEQMYEQIKIED